MKIICIGRNYAAHAAELGNDIPAEPVIFMKPSTALQTGGKPFFHPSFSDDIHYECELVLRVCRNGKAVEERFAPRYYDQIGLGLDFTARDIQQACKAKGLPWEKAKAFDNSAVLGDMIPLSELKAPDDIGFSLNLNGQTVQRGQSSLMLFNFNRIIAEVTKYFRIQDGDLIFTGTPAGVGRIQPGDHLVGQLEGRELLSCRVK